MQIKIGTRNSPLALWQAREVEKKLQNIGHETVLVPVLASGDKNLRQPLYSLGISGVFTKDLDAALLDKKIDVAAHSLKDVPTLLPQGVALAAVLQRDFPQDVLVRKNSTKNVPMHELKVATSSLRRRAFWLKEFKTAEFADIRGNVQTRLKKLEENDMDATIFSLAGLKRMNLNIDYEELRFMVPAPAQGVVAVACLTDNQEITEVLKQINHRETEICTNIERNFLQTLEGGCTAPIGAFAEINGDRVRFVGHLCSLDGKNSMETDEIFQWNETENFGEKFAKILLHKGGKEIMQKIKNFKS